VSPPEFANAAIDEEFPFCYRYGESLMKPIEFQMQNMVWGKNQSEYLPLPAFVDDYRTITCWRLTWHERMRLWVTGRVWLTQLNFGQALQPQRLSMDSPFDLDKVAEVPVVSDQGQPVQQS
jgi:hypothetical protein